MDMNDSTQRFSDRVENYVKFRPSYPAEVLDLLIKQTQIKENAVIADIGSGTGKLTEILLRDGHSVIAVEPNAPMREAAEVLFAKHPNFVSSGGSAEETGLEDNSVDLITAGQAFHWFDVPKATTEFQRILKPSGCVVLIWNRRRIEESNFQSIYDAILQKWGTDYNKVKHHNVTDEVLKEFYGGEGFQIHNLEYYQEFDFEALKGRLLSASYTPQADHPNHEPMMTELKKAFDENQSEGRIQFDYDTNIYIGKLD